MKRVLKWVGYGLGAVFALAIIAVLAIYARSEWLLRKHWEVPEQALALEGAAIAEADAGEGRRLALVLGCYNGCHGERADGQVFVDRPNLARLIAPSLSHLAATRSDAGLVRSIRFGVKPDGTSVRAMPSQALYHMTDAQLASVLAFLESQPPSDPIEEQNEYRFFARLGIALGQFPTPAATTTAMPERLDPDDPDDPHAQGRQLAVIACAECHGDDLQGAEFGLTTPALGIVRGYDRDAFGTLMRTGEGIGGRDLGLMSRVARGRFSALTDDEVDALYTYLHETGGRDLVEPATQ